MLPPAPPLDGNVLIDTVAGRSALLSLVLAPEAATLNLGLAAGLTDPLVPALPAATDTAVLTPGVALGDAMKLALPLAAGLKEPLVPALPTARDAAVLTPVLALGDATRLTLPPPAAFNDPLAALLTAGETTVLLPILALGDAVAGEPALELPRLLPSSNDVHKGRNGIPSTCARAAWRSVCSAAQALRPRPWGDEAAAAVGLVPLTA